MRAILIFSLAVLFSTALVWASEEDSLILQNGLIPTDKENYFISSDFEIRSTSDGKFIRLSGMTAEGYPYYVIQKTINDSLSGFVFVNGNIIRVNSEIIPDILEIEDDLEPVMQMIMLVEQSNSGQYYDTYRFTAKLFDIMINPNPSMSSFDGTLENIAINVTISTDNTVLTSFAGKTGNKGIFEGQYIWGYSDNRGTFNVSIIAESGDSILVENFTTQYLGYIPPDD